MFTDLSLLIECVLCKSSSLARCGGSATVSLFIPRRVWMYSELFVLVPLVVMVDMFLGTTCVQTSKSISRNDSLPVRLATTGQQPIKV